MDTNCTCESEFKLGVSEHFSKSVSIQPPNQPQASSKPYTVYEDILNEFSSIDNNNELVFPNENRVINEMKTDFESRFDDVIQMRKKNLTSVPEHFYLNKDISLAMTGLEQKIAAEKLNVGSSKLDTSQIVKMENILNKMKGEVGEHEVYSGFKRIWHGKRGVFIHSFQPEDVLSPLTLKAKAKRNSEKTLSKTKLEKTLSNQLNIDVTTGVASIIAKIKNLYPGCISMTESELLLAIEKVVDDKKKRHEISSIIKNLTKLTYKTDYTFDEAENAISIGLTHHHFRPHGEIDFLAILPDERLIVNIEVKQQIATNPRNAKNLLKEASYQMKRNEKYLARLLSPMLSQGWRLAKVGVILPGNLKHGDICEHCQKFLIDKSSLNSLDAWWKQSCLENTQKSQTNYHQFLKVIELVAPTKSTGNLSAWTRITGTKCKGPINAGHTQTEEPPVSSKGKSKQGKRSKNYVELDKALARVHDTEKLLFFSSRQLDILSSSLFSKIIIWGDYGTGKLI